MSQANEHPELNPVEAVLSGLRPTAPTINRDALMFRAGKSTAARWARFWQAAAAGFALLAVGLGGALVWRPAPERQIVYEEVESEALPDLAVPYSPERDAPEPGRPSYLQLRNRVLEEGVEALPNPPPAPDLPPLNLDQIY